MCEKENVQQTKYKMKCKSLENETFDATTLTHISQ